MENFNIMKKSTEKENSASVTMALRVSPETQKKILDEISRINKEKEFGQKIKPDAFVALAITLMKSKHFEVLKEASLTNEDRIERGYQEYLKQHGDLSKDEYLGLLLSGKLNSVEVSEHETSLRISKEKSFESK